mgnify:CR=1 FL=1
MSGDGNWIVKVQYDKASDVINCDSEAAAKEVVRQIHEGLNSEQRFLSILDGSAIVRIADLRTVTIEPAEGPAVGVVHWGRVQY